jgi:hypothetical protein
MEELKVAGTTAGKVQDMIAFEEFDGLIGLPEYYCAARPGRTRKLTSAPAWARCSP